MTSYGVMGRGRAQFGRLGGALAAVTGLLAGCDETGAGGGGDAGPDAGVGFVSADPRGDGGTGGIETQGITVGIRTDESADQLSVGLGTRADAGVTDAGSPVTSHPDSETSAVPAVSTDSGASAPPAATSEDVPTAETSWPADTTEAPRTSTEPDVTGSASIDASAPGETTGEISADIVADASWVDLPATFEAVNLPDIDLTFTWSVTSVPVNSEISDASLDDPNRGTVSFVPDVAGTYELTLVVASGPISTTIDASVEVSKVDVAFLRITNSIDGGYVHEPQMVPSDGTLEPFGVGCSFDTWDWDPRDYTFWRNALNYESQAMGFRYPSELGQETLFAYHYRAANDDGFTHVATAQSDCGTNRPVDLQVGTHPDFSPSASELSRIDDGDGTYLFWSPADEDTVVYPSASEPMATDWWDEASILWAGYVDNGEVAELVIGVSPTAQEGYATILDCSSFTNDLPIFEDDVKKVAAVPGGLMVLAGYGLWYLPVLSADDVVYASCEYAAEGNVYVAGTVADFEVAPDGQTVALITRLYEGDEPRAVLGIGPVGAAFSTEDTSWRSFDVGNPYDYYTGLHWIAGSQQLVWTSLQYTEQSDGNYVYTDLLDSAVYKINADGTQRRTLVYDASTEGYQQSAVTTGRVDLIATRYVGGLTE